MTERESIDKTVLIVEKIIGGTIASMANTYKLGVFAVYPDGVYRNTANGYRRKFDPLTSPTDAFEMQAELKKSPKRWSEYIYRLVMDGRGEGGAMELYTYLVDASPAQRSDAAIAVLDVPCD